MIRRTITVRDRLNRAINHFRGYLLEKHNMDLDFTSAINMLADLGYLRIASGNLSDEEWETVRSYLFHLEELKKESALDQATDAWLKSELSRMFGGARKK